MAWCNSCAHIAEGNREILARYIDARRRLEDEFDPERRDRLEAELCLLAEERVRWAQLRKHHIVESGHVFERLTRSGIVPPPPGVPLFRSGV